MPVVPLDTVPDVDVETLLDLAFGQDRHGRTAYFVREGMDPIGALSIGWVENGTLVGSVQCWPVCHHGDDGEDRPMIMVGPVAVHPDRQQQGIGKALMRRAMELHDALPIDEQAPMMMIGDAPYYRQWGFTADATQQWRLPGPFERDRLLSRWLGGDPLPKSGDIGPRG